MVEPWSTAILVHGTWHDGSCWDAVVAELAHRGVPAIAPTLPSSNPPRAARAGPARSGGAGGRGELPGFADDVAVVSALVEATPGPVLLCGHGYGGMVISAVGGHERVVELVYLAGFCPRPGQSALSIVGRSVGPAPYSRRRTDDGLSVVGAWTAARFLYHDLSRTDRARRLTGLVPSTAEVLRASVTEPAWLTTPATYVTCRRDRAIDRQRQRRMADLVIRSRLANRWPGEHTMTLDTGHCPFYVDPAAVAEVLVRSGR